MHFAISDQLEPMDRLLWMYWEDVEAGHKRPPYLDLCLETVRKNAGSPTLHLLDQDSVPDWLPDLPDGVWRRLPTPVYRADYARTRLIHRYGGLWLDFDVIVMAPLDEVFYLM